jgi:hypothetical protein
MSETFRAQCNSASGDYVTAEISGDKVELVGHSGDDNVMNAFVTAINARTFARGILALADEIDGGEQVAVPAPVRSRPKVGDRVAITKYRHTESGGYVGKEGTLEVVDLDDDYLTYRVQFDDAHGVWAADVRRVDESAASSSIKPGDRVRVLDDDGGLSYRRFVGRIGTVKNLTGYENLPYKVEFGDGRGPHGAENGWWNCKAVERVDEPTETDAIKVGDKVRVTVDRANCADVKAGDVFTVASLETNLSPGVRTTSVPTRSGGWFFSLDVVEKVTDEPADGEQPADVDSVPSSRAALLEKAGELLGVPGFGSTADDLIKLADYLAGE